MSYTLAIPKVKLSCPNHPKYVPTILQNHHASCQVCEAIWRTYIKLNLQLLPALHDAQRKISDVKELRAARKARHER